MGPATRSWVCPTCGVQNGPAPATASTPKLRSRKPSPFAGSERVPLIVVVVAAVVVIAVVWALLGHGKSTPATGTNPPSPSLTAAQATAKLCDDIPIDQNLRVDALNREAQQVRTDAEAIRNAGDRPTARKAVAVAVAMENFAKTLETHGATTDVTNALNAAIETLQPSCQAG